jgi:hypothetical protein
MLQKIKIEVSDTIKNIHVMKDKFIEWTICCIRILEYTSSASYITQRLPTAI